MPEAEVRMVGILVHGDNHFIVNGPAPSPEQAMELATLWSLITIGSTTPEHLRQWTISTKEFRENLKWAVVLKAASAPQPAVELLLAELEARAVPIHRIIESDNSAVPILRQW